MSLWQKIPIDIIDILFKYLDINSKINLILSNKTLHDIVYREEYIQKSLVSVYFKTLKNNLNDSSFNSSVLKNILRYSNSFIFDEEFFKNINLYINTLNNRDNDSSYAKRYFPNTIPCHCSSSYVFHINGDILILDFSNYLICSFKGEAEHNRHFSDIYFFKYNGCSIEEKKENMTSGESKTTAVATATSSDLKTFVECNIQWPHELLYIEKISLNDKILPMILNVDQLFPIFYKSSLLVSDSKYIYILELKYTSCCETNEEFGEEKIKADNDYNNKAIDLDLTNILFKKYISTIFEASKTIDISKEYAVVYLQISSDEQSILYLKKSKDENNKTTVTVIGEKKILYCENLVSFNIHLGIFFYNTEFAARLVFLDYDIDNINNDANSCIKTTLFFNKRLNRAVCLSKYIYLTLRRLKLTIVKVSANSNIEIESYTNLTVFDENGDTVIVNDISFIENTKLVCLKLLNLNKIFFTNRLLDCFLKHEENNIDDYDRDRYSNMRFYKTNSDTEYINFCSILSFVLPIPLKINCLVFGLVKFYEYHGYIVNSKTMQVFKTNYLNSASTYRILNLDGEMNLKIY